MRILQYDIEGDGLLDTISTIHCIVCKEMISGKVLRFYDPIEDFKPEDTDYPLAYARPVFQKATTLIGHNILGYDNDVLERFLGINTKNKNIIDTLVWSQTLNPDRQLPKGCPAVAFNPEIGRNDKIGPHSVAAWGYRVARAKPSHYDWSRFSYDMLHRCTEDVMIQEKIFYALMKEADLKLEDVYV